MYTQWDPPAANVQDITVFRSFVQDLHNKFISNGLVQVTAIPNQFDFVTEPDPTNTSSNSVTDKQYRPLYYKFTDDGLIPTYIKVQYSKISSSSTALNRQRLMPIITIATDLDITGYSTNVIATFSNASSTVYMSADTTHSAVGESSIIFNATSAGVSRFGVMSVPGYTYQADTTRKHYVMFFSIVRTQREVLVNANTTSTSITSASGSYSYNYFKHTTYVGTRLASYKQSSIDLHDINDTFLNYTTGLMKTHVYALSGKLSTRPSPVLFIYNKQKYADGSINVIEGDSYYMLGNLIQGMVVSSDAGIAIKLT